MTHEGGVDVSPMSKEGGVNAVAFSPNGDYLATASGDGTARVWRTIGGREGAHVTHGGSPLADVGFSSNGKFLATASMAVGLGGIEKGDNTVRFLGGG
jgi:WD40 repeat protein